MFCCEVNVLREFYPNCPYHFYVWKSSYKIANQTQILQIGILAKSPPSFLYEMRTAARAARKISYEIANQTQLSPLKIDNFCQIVPLNFL